MIRISKSPITSGIGALAAAFALAVIAAATKGVLRGSSERLLLLVPATSLILLPLAAVVHALVRRRAIDPWRLAILSLVGIAVVVSALDLRWLWAHVSFPADILIWSEGDFVNDILKLRVGYPLYTPQANNESFIYTPGSQALTWLISALTGRQDSIVFYRSVQVAYTVAAAVIATLCCRRLLRLATDRPLENASLWGALWLPVLFLISTNELTNPFVQNLHNDALAQLISITAYWILLEYVATRRTRLLILMAVMPALGFLVKQSLAQWMVLYFLQLMLLSRPRLPMRAIAVAAGSVLSLGAVFGLCLLLWGEPFTYWTVTVLKAHPFSPLRSVQHAIDAGAYLAIGIAGGLLLMHRGPVRILAGPWLIWLIAFAIAAYTSGVAWMLNHLGPVSLIAGVWFLAGIARVWPASSFATPGESKVGLDIFMDRWLRPISVALLGFVVLGGLRTIRPPVPPFSADAERYVREIEGEFSGHSADSILLDAGTWVYLADRTIMKDRAPSFGDRGYGEVGDFSGMTERLRTKRYSKILVRNLESPDFWYDHYFWRRSSGIRKALTDNYQVTRTIAAVDSGDIDRPARYLFREVSVLVPRTP